LAPSSALWKWFHHDADKISQFRTRYFRELQGKKTYWLRIVQESEKNEVALLYHGKHDYLTPAHFLKEFLDIQLETHPIFKSRRKKRIGLTGKGVAAPVEKSISRKHKLPLREEMSFVPEQKMTQVPAERRRMI